MNKALFYANRASCGFVLSATVLAGFYVPAEYLLACAAGSLVAAFLPRRSARPPVTGRVEDVKLQVTIDGLEIMSGEFRERIARELHEMVEYACRGERP